MTNDLLNTAWGLCGTWTHGEHGSRILRLQDVEDKVSIEVALMSLYTLMYKILNDQSAPHLRGCLVVFVTKRCSKVCWCSFSFRLLTQRNGN